MDIDEIIKKLKEYSGRNILSLGSPFTFGGFGNISETTFRSPLDDIKDVSEMMKINNLIEKLEKKKKGEIPRYCFSNDEIELIQNIINNK